MSSYTCILQVELDVGQKNLKKTLPLKFPDPPVFYNGKSTFSTSDFCNTRFSNVDFDLYFVDAIWCFLKKH